MPIELGVFSIGLLTGTLLTMLIDRFIGHRLSRSRAKENRLASAWNAECLTFKAVFVDALSDLCAIEEPYCVAAILRRRFPDHQAAYVRFALRVTGQTKRDLEDAWREYDKYHQESEELVLRVSGVDVPESHQRKIVVGHINRLLSFAKET